MKISLTPLIRASKTIASICFWVAVIITVFNMFLQVQRLPIYTDLNQLAAVLVLMGTAFLCLPMLDKKLPPLHQDSKE